MEPFFLPSTGDNHLFALWRGAQNASRVWVVLTPLGEEEKGARRVLTEIIARFTARGEASLLISPRGVGDSFGTFESLQNGRDDLQSAITEAQNRAPNAETALLGIRWSASWILEQDAPIRVAIEPITRGGSWVTQLVAQRKIRAQLGEKSGGATQISDEEDFDGWRYSPELRAEMKSFDLNSSVQNGTKTLIVGVGPRDEIAPPLRALGEKIGADTCAVKMPAFWNQIDYSAPGALLEALDEWRNTTHL